MTARIDRLGLFVTMMIVGVLAGVVHAAPPPDWMPPTKPSKAQLEVEKHEVLAQYLLMRANDSDGAAKEYQAILTLDPKNTRAALALASIYEHGQKGKLAVDVLIKLTKRSPKSPDAWLALAELQREQGDDKAATATIAKAVALDPTSQNVQLARFDLAYARAKAGDDAAKAEALEAAKAVRALARNNAWAEKHVARALVELSGDPMELTVYDAKAAYASAFDSPIIGDINAQMAKARAGFEECTRSTPKNEDCHYYLGLVYSSVKASQAYDAKKALAELQLAPTLPLAWVEQARLYRAGNDDANARAALGKALAIDKSCAAAQVELGVLDKVAGNTDSAATHFVAAIDADPWGTAGERALVELGKVKPNHPYVAQGLMMGKSTGDVFSSDRYQALIGLLEQQLGGVEPAAPEKAVVEDIVQRLADASGVRLAFKIAIVGTSMPNAMALADGRVYVTRGLIDMMKKKFPSRAIDADNEMLAHVLAHELQHVLRRHVLSSAVFQEAMKSSGALDPSVLTSATRLQEIDADRQGMVMAFLAGYPPRGGIALMEAMGQEGDIPQHLDHPTFQERVEYLTDYWTDDVRYAFVSFKLGVAAMDRGSKLESTDMTSAVAAYEEAVDDFKRYRTMLPSLKEAMNDLGIAYAKLGVLAMAAGDTPLARWQTRFSLERESALKYVGLVQNDEQSRSRGVPGGATRIPWQLRESISQFKEAIASDESYAKARLNLALAYVAANQLDNALEMLAKAEAKGGVTTGDIELVRGVVLAENKDFAHAQGSFQQALNTPATKRAGAYNLAKTLELAGKKDDAKRAYQQYVKMFPGGAWADAAQAAAAKL
jgi:tetratricopeptide (TPR) repeat protein